MSKKLEEALRERRRQVKENIERLERQKKDYGDKTHWRTTEDKRWRDRFNDRLQTEWNKHTEQMMIAKRGGIEL